MKLFFYELQKIFGNKKILAFLLGITLINIAFLAYNEYNDAFLPSDYNMLWHDLDKMTDIEKMNFLEEKSAALLNYDIEDEAESFCYYTESIYSELTLTDYVKNEVNNCLTYNQYLTDISKNGETLAAIPFFADKAGFDYKNIMKTCEDFRHLEGKALSPWRSKGILAATSFGFTDIVAALLIIFLNVILISREKELEQINLFRTSYNGGIILAVSKLAAIFTADIAIVVLLYGGSIGTGYFLYGFGDLSRSIQSVYSFGGSSLDITVGEFLIYFLLLKIAACLAFSALCFFLSVLTRGSVFNIILTAIVIVVEGVLYFFIEPSSILAPLRQINIVAAADSERLLGKYLNINIFGTPVFALLVSIIVMAAVIVLFSALGVLFFCSLGQFNGKKINISLPFGKHMSLLLHEINKTFIGGKALTIIAAFVLFILFTYVPKKISYSSTSDFIYTKYVNSLQGEITAEKIEYIETELENAYLDFDETSANRIEALERLKSHALYLWKNGGMLFNEKGYDMLTGEDRSKQEDRFTAFVMAAIVTVIAAYIYCDEYKTGVHQLLRSSEKGRGQTFFCKLFTSLLASFAILLIFNGTNFYNVLSAYGTEFIFAPINSIERLEFVGKVPIFWYLAGLEAGRLISLTIQSVVIFFISSRLKSYSLTVTAGILFFGIPPVISASGVTYMDYFFLNPLLIGNVF